MFGWLSRNWKTIAVAVVATVVFVAVTAATGGLGAPVLASLAAGGFASGVAGYVTGQLLDGQPVSAVEAVKAGAISTVVTVATAGVGRVLAPAFSRVVAPVANRVPRVIAAAAPPVLRRVVGDATVGATLGAGIKVGENAVRGRPLGEGVEDAAIIYGALGAAARPATALIEAPIANATARAAGRAPAPQARGMAKALEELSGPTGKPEPEVARPAGEPVARPTAEPAGNGNGNGGSPRTTGPSGGLGESPNTIRRVAAPSPAELAEIERVGAGARNFNNPELPGFGRVEPISPVTAAEREAIASAAGPRQPTPRVLTEAELAALENGRSLPSNSIRSGDAAASDNYSAAARRVNEWVRSGQDLDLAKIQELNRLLLEGSPLAAKGGVTRDVTGDWVGHGRSGGAPFFYANPENVPAYLNDFMAWYRANQGTMPPVELAAAAYQQLVRIHPFVDSNGRTTRLVMDWILQRNGYPPAVFDNVKAEAVHSTTADLAGRVARGVSDANATLNGGGTTPR